MKKITLGLLLLITCSYAKKADQPITPGMTSSIFDKQGHRGCRGLMPENTIPAMIRAIDLGVTTLEMDTHITKDDQVILSHDPFFNHEITTKPDGTYMTEAEEKNYVIYRMNYSETLQFDVGLKPHPRFPQQQKMAIHKPLLADLIDSVEAYCHINKKPLPFYNIETKSLKITDGIYHPVPERFVELLMGVILSKGIKDRVIIQSFDIRTLQSVHRRFPGVATALLIEGYDKRGLNQQLEELGFEPAIYSPEYTLVNEALITDCHAKQIRVIPWTVDDRENIDRLKKTGVDGIISDYPNLFD